MPHYDVVILGAGPGGYVAAVRSAQLGLSTAIIEEKYWGGICLNVGCIPSKSLLKNAELAHTLNHKADFFGISGDFTIDFGKAFDRSREVADGRVKGIHFLMKKNKVTEYDGRGTFTGPKAISVAKSDGSTEEVTFDNVIVATGSTVQSLPGIELSENVVSFEEQILSRELPGSIVIVGAGAIGMEFAYVLTNYGVKVTIVEFLDRALPNEDPDVSKEITKQYKKLRRRHPHLHQGREWSSTTAPLSTSPTRDKRWPAGLDRRRQGADVGRVRPARRGLRTRHDRRRTSPSAARSISTTT